MTSTPNGAVSLNFNISRYHYFNFQNMNFHIHPWTRHGGHTLASDMPCVQVGSIHPLP